jgi:hypothetical protein
VGMLGLVLWIEYLSQIRVQQKAAVLPGTLRPFGLTDRCDFRTPPS